MVENNSITIRLAADAASRLRKHTLSEKELDKVKIHSGPSADKPSLHPPSNMPSISESPLEQDFTTSGTPSKLGCPFAGMANKRLSKHAASVVSRYRPSGTATPRSSISRMNEKPPSVTHASLSLPEPTVQTEMCGMESPKKSVVDVE